MAPVFNKPIWETMANLNLKGRSLSVLSLVMINIIAIDSLRNLPINAANGLTIPFYYFITCILFLIPCALITAELATHYPETGGAYVWVRNAFGPRLGFMTIWLQWIYNVFWYPTILAFVAANIAYFIDPALINNKVYMVSMIVGLFALATIINSFGMKTSSLVSIVSAIVGTILPMLLIIALAIVWLAHHEPIAITPNAMHFLPHLNNLNNIAFVVVILFSVFGLEMSATHAESVKNPKKDYPRALLFSSIFIIISLTLASLAIAIIVPADQLSLVGGLDQAFAAFLAKFHLSYLLPFIVLAIIIGSFGSIAAWVIGPTKGLMVAAHDGSLPKFFSYQNSKGSPIIVLILQAILVFAICFLFVGIKSFSTSYWILSDLTAQLAILFYILFFSAAIRLHRKTPVKEGAFRMKNWVMNTAACCGLLISFFALVIGFIPPADIKIQSFLGYELILVLGLVVFAVLPLLITYIPNKD